MRELDPQTPLEKLFATGIMSANWRLRRCRVIEVDLALQSDTDERTQRSVDRARAQSHVIVRRSMNELRKLQTERVIRAHAELPGIAGFADTAKIVAVVDRVSENWCDGQSIGRQANRTRRSRSAHDAG